MINSKNLWILLSCIIIVLLISKCKYSYIESGYGRRLSLEESLSDTQLASIPVNTEELDYDTFEHYLSDIKKKTIENTEGARSRDILSRTDPSEYKSLYLAACTAHEVYPKSSRQRLAKALRSKLGQDQLQISTNIADGLLDTVEKSEHNCSTIRLQIQELSQTD